MNMLRGQLTKRLLKPFDLFQEKFRELAEFTLAKPDEHICLAHFEEPSCKSAHCICGNMPELWPDVYGWQNMNNQRVPYLISNPLIHGDNLIFSLAALNPYNLNPTVVFEMRGLFGTNRYPWSARAEIENRLEDVYRAINIGDIFRRRVKRWDDYIYQLGKINATPYIG